MHKPPPWRTQNSLLSLTLVLSLLERLIAQLQNIFISSQLNDVYSTRKLLSYTGLLKVFPD